MLWSRFAAWAAMRPGTPDRVTAMGPRRLGAVCALAAAIGLAVPAAAVAARPPMVHAGHARFEVLTPTLIRLEYAQDGHFQNAPTMTATRAPLPATRFESPLAGGRLSPPRV